MARRLILSSSVRAEPFGCAQDGPVEALIGQILPFDRLRANGRFINRLLVVCGTLVVAACSTPTVIGGDVFDLHRNAVLAYESGDDAKAEALYQGLARAAPSDPEIWLRLGNLYARSNKPDDAADAYQHALLLNRNDLRAWYNLGVIRQRQAHAAFIQANLLADKSDPAYARTEAMIEKLAPAKTPAAPADVIEPEAKHDAPAQ